MNNNVQKSQMPRGLRGGGGGGDGEDEASI